MCPLGHIESGYTCRFLWGNQLWWGRPQRLRKVVVSSMGKWLFCPQSCCLRWHRHIWCLQRVASRARVWSTYLTCSASNSQLDSAIFGPSTMIPKPIPPVPAVPACADVCWSSCRSAGHLGMCRVKGSTKLAFGSGHSPRTSGEMPAGLDQLQVSSQILKDGPCSNYCMLRTLSTLLALNVRSEVTFLLTVGFY